MTNISIDAGVKAMQRCQGLSVKDARQRFLALSREDQQRRFADMPQEEQARRILTRCVGFSRLQAEKFLAELTRQELDVLLLIGEEPRNGDLMHQFLDHVADRKSGERSAESEEPADPPPAAHAALGEEELPPWVTIDPNADAPTELEDLPTTD